MFDVSRYVSKYVDKCNRRYNFNLEVYDAPVYEEYNGIIFIYFTTRAENFIWYCKRYHQLAVGCYGIEVYYEDSNVIDIDKNYPLSEVRVKFTNWCKHFLKKLE